MKRRFALLAALIFADSIYAASSVSRRKGALNTNEVSYVSQLAQGYSATVSGDNDINSSSIIVGGGRNSIGLGQAISLDALALTSVSVGSYEMDIDSGLKSPEIFLLRLGIGFGLEWTQLAAGVQAGAAMEKVNLPYYSGGFSPDNATTDEEKLSHIIYRQSDKRAVAEVWISYKPTWFPTLSVEQRIGFSQKRRASHMHSETGLFFQLSNSSLFGLNYLYWKSSKDTVGAPGFTISGPGMSFGYNIGT